MLNIFKSYACYWSDVCGAVDSTQGPEVTWSHFVWRFSGPTPSSSPPALCAGGVVLGVWFNTKVPSASQPPGSHGICQSRGGVSSGWPRQLCTRSFFSCHTTTAGPLGEWESRLKECLNINHHWIECRFLHYMSLISGHPNKPLQHSVKRLQGIGLVRKASEINRDSQIF